jgi:hypothetical protein
MMNDLYTLAEPVGVLLTMAVLLWLFERRLCLRFGAVLRRNRWPGE